MVTRIALVCGLCLAISAAALADEPRQSRYTYRNLAAGNADQLAQQPVAANSTVVRAQALVGNARPVTSTTSTRTSDLRAVAVSRPVVSPVAAVRPATYAIATQPARQEPLVVDSQVQPQVANDRAAVDNNARIVGDYNAAYQPATVAPQAAQVQYASAAPVYYTAPATTYVSAGYASGSGYISGGYVSAPSRSYYYPTGYYGHATVFYGGNSCYTPTYYAPRYAYSGGYCAPRYYYPSYHCSTPRYSYRSCGGYGGGSYYGGGGYVSGGYYGGGHGSFGFSYSKNCGSSFGIRIGW